MTSRGYSSVSLHESLKHGSPGAGLVRRLSTHRPRKNECFLVGSLNLREQVPSFDEHAPSGPDRLYIATAASIFVQRLSCVAPMELCSRGLPSLQHRMPLSHCLVSATLLHRDLGLLEVLSNTSNFY